MVQDQYPDTAHIFKKSDSCVCVIIFEVVNGYDGD